VEFRFFEVEYSDARWIQAKKKGADGDPEPQEKRKGFTVTPDQKTIFQSVRKYVLNRPEKAAGVKPLDLPSTLPTRDRKFVEQLADDLRMPWTTVSDDHGERFIRIQFPVNEDEEEEEEEDEEASMAVHRVLRRYDNAKVQELSGEEAREAAEKKYDEKFQEWKENYYQTKFGWGMNDHEQMRQLTENYVQGLQWVLFYYYRGIASWPWFFRHHYAPMISGESKAIHTYLPHPDCLQM
jgi:5'-3' exoribonuclease 1